MASDSIPVILDCDPGIDDALALALLSAHSDVQILGVTTVAGNVPLGATTDNALRLREFYRCPDVPVYAGAERPLSREPVFAEYVHGVDGLGGAPVPAATRHADAGTGADFIVQQLRERPGEITLIAIGPMTNLALALRQEPRVAEWAKQVVLMGGAYTRGNITPAAEFNFFADPEAAAAVLAASWRPVLVTLDLTLQARVDEAILSRWSGFGPLSDQLLLPALSNYFDNRARNGVELTLPDSVSRGGSGPAIHDACAVAYAIAPDLFGAVPAHTAIETQGELTAGMSVVDFAGEPNSLVVTDIDLDRFWALLTDAFETVTRRMQQA